MKVLLNRRQQLQHQNNQQYPNSQSTDLSSTLTDWSEQKEVAIDAPSFWKENAHAHEIVDSSICDTDIPPELDSIHLLTATNLEHISESSHFNGSLPKHKRQAEDLVESLHSSKRIQILSTDTDSFINLDIANMVQYCRNKDDKSCSSHPYGDKQQTCGIDKNREEDPASDFVPESSIIIIELSKSQKDNTSTYSLTPIHDKAMESKLKSCDGNQKSYSDRSWEHRLQNFLEELRTRGLDMVVQDGDGNCLFRAVSLQVYGDADQHFDIRQQCLDYMEKEKEHFSQFINDEHFSSYVNRKRRDGEHGNNLEIQAISELFNRPVEVFVPDHGATPINIFHTDYKTTDVPIRLSYHDGNHYNAIVDPLCPTAGLGLCLPGLEIGLADRMQLQAAKDESDKLHVKKVAEDTYLTDLHRVMEESKLSAHQQLNSNMDIYTQQKLLALSDWKETSADLEQVAIQNSMESFWAVEQNRKQPWNYNHLHRRRNKNNCRSGSPAYSCDNQDRLRSTGHSLAPIADATRLANIHGTTPIVSSSYASSSVNSLSGTEHEVARSDSTDSSVEYPQTIQELVMNGFELSKVIRAYELIGDNFDDILNFLLSNKQI